MSEQLTIEEAARKLKDLAQLTAEHSRNWTNFIEIARSMLQQTYDAGKVNGVIRPDGVDTQ